jgi:hypothetical protein
MLPLVLLGQKVSMADRSYIHRFKPLKQSSFRFILYICKAFIAKITNESFDQIQKMKAYASEFFGVVSEIAQNAPHILAEFT